MSDFDNNGWHEYKRLILDRLESNEEQHRMILLELRTMRDEITAAKVNIKLLALGFSAIGAGAGTVLSKIAAHILGG